MTVFAVVGSIFVKLIV